MDTIKYIAIWLGFLVVAYLIYINAAASSG